MWMKSPTNDSKDMNSIINGLANPVFVKVMHCKTSKEMWDKLKHIYEGDTRVKKEKLQTYRAQFESLEMKEEEIIGEYFLRVDEIVNADIGLGENVPKEMIMQKVLRSLSLRYHSKISSLEDRKNLGKLAMDELHSILIAYEMRIR